MIRPSVYIKGSMAICKMCHVFVMTHIVSGVGVIQYKLSESSIKVGLNNAYHKSSRSIDSQDLSLLSYIQLNGSNVICYRCHQKYIYTYGKWQLCPLIIVKVNDGHT